MHHCQLTVDETISFMVASPLFTFHLFNQILRKLSTKQMVPNELNLGVGLILQLKKYFLEHDVYILVAPPIQFTATVKL